MENSLITGERVAEDLVELPAELAINYHLELSRLRQDWERILVGLEPPEDPGKLIAVAWMGNSAPCKEKRDVLFTFNSGWRIIYRPRSLAFDLHFQELLGWLNQQGQQLQLPQLRLLDCGIYGWSEYKEAQECASRAAMERFCERLGAYLALLYALNATRVQSENVIAVGEQPLLVDLSEVFHLSKPEDGKRRSYQHPAMQAFIDSALPTGLLPGRSASGKQGYRLPGLKGMEVMPWEYSETLLQGFQDMYRRLLVYRAAILRDWLPRLFTTRLDGQDLLNYQGESLPEIFAEISLQAVAQRLQSLCKEDLEHQSWRIRVSLSAQAIKQPVITPVMMKELLAQPVQKGVSRERLVEAACAVGEQLHRWAVYQQGAAGWLGLMALTENEWAVRPTQPDLYNGTSGIALFLGYLGFITGNVRYTELARSAIETVRIEIQQWQRRRHKLTRPGMFSDTPGGAIYLFTHLGTIWKEPALWSEAQVLVDLLSEYIEQDTWQDIISGSAGAIAYLLNLYAATPAPRTLAAAIRCGEHLLRRAQPQQAGIGWSTIPGQPPLGGFAHGAAGIAWSLLRLAAASGQERFCCAALEALAYERSLFVPKHGNWLIPLPSSTRPAESTLAQQSAKNVFKVAWCHGAPGIGLARLTSLDYLDDEQIREEIAIALQTTLKEGFGRNHSLCHGDFGNLETLLLATRISGDPGYHQHLDHITALLLASFDTYGWITGAPSGIETPGLLTGLAGIGYQLLRMAEPDKVPSVLACL